jgi:hypothetical protein
MVVIFWIHFSQVWFHPPSKSDRTQWQGSLAGDEMAATGQGPEVREVCFYVVFGCNQGTYLKADKSATRSL